MPPRASLQPARWPDRARAGHQFGIRHRAVRTAANGSQSNWLIATHTDGKSTWFIFTVGDSQTEGKWLLAVTSTSATANGLFSVQVTLDPSPFVPTALTELDYTYYADGSVETVTESRTRGAQRQGGHHDLRL